jgi:hypothetical protein
VASVDEGLEFHICNSPCLHIFVLNFNLNWHSEINLNMKCHSESLPRSNGNKKPNIFNGWLLCTEVYVPLETRISISLENNK